MQSRQKPNGQPPGSDTRLREWLRSLQADQYYDLFLKEEVTFEDIPLLTKEDLRDMGIPLGPARRMLSAAETRSTPFSTLPPAIPELPKSQEIPSEDSFSQVLTTISRQQVGMMRTIQGLQVALEELQQLRTVETEPAAMSPSQLHLPEESPERKYWRETEEPRQEVSLRLRSHTLSSLAKQRRLPNKYMRVSNLRLSYLLRSQGHSST